jgi:hypothetical protein
MSDSGDALAIATLEQLLRSGALGRGDVDAIADRLTSEGDETAAHWARAALVQAGATPVEDWRADQARARFRVVPSDGGNDAG